MLHLTACEPIPVVMTIWWSGTASTAKFVTGSAAVLLAVVLLKSILFARFAKIGYVKGFLAMFIANIASTIPGVIIAFAISVMPQLDVLFWISIVLVIWLGSLAGRVYRSAYGEAFDRIGTPSAFGWLTFLAMILSLFAAATSYSLAEQDEVIFMFFVAKSFMMFCMIGGSLILTVAWEAGVVGWLVSGWNEEPDIKPLIPAVVKANLWTALIIATIGAAFAIPDRMKDPSFRLRSRPGSHWSDF